jgi:23S rRNA pseudouridine1911/1915/1917 synthase
MRNRGHEYAEIVGADAHDIELADYLARRYRHTSREEWRARIAAGQVRLDRHAVPPDARLRAGQRLAWLRPPWDEPAAPATFAVLYRDRELLAVAKPAGLPTLPGAGFLENTLLHRVRVLDPRAAAVHRLGRWTSGVVLFASTPEARRGLGAQWAARTVGKRYRALAAGSPEFDERTVEMPVGPVPHPLLGSVHAASTAGKPATSRIRVVERRRGAFLCDVDIVTGRPHQVRIHLAAAGHPLTGDPLYGPGGGPRPGSRALPGDPGYRLHAARLEVRHPLGGSLLTLECAPPPALRAGQPCLRSTSS